MPKILFILIVASVLGMWIRLALLLRRAARPSGRASDDDRDVAVIRLRPELIVCIVATVVAVVAVALIGVPDMFD